MTDKDMFHYNVMRNALSVIAAFSGDYKIMPKQQCRLYLRLCNEMSIRTLSTLDSDYETLASVCGANARGGPCILSVGHNKGNADLPAYHYSGR